MGQATDRKVTEIEETRTRLEADLLELESRMPAPLRSGKSIAGLVLGGIVLASVLRRLKPGRSERHPTAEVVIRVVRDDLHQ
jgi:pyrimidine operon attenuation protein/uracil phosphoribosyltransferase